MRSIWLLQEGLIREDIGDDLVNDLDSLVSWEYMGASEYEFGALFTSWKNIKENSDNYHFINIPKKGRYIKNVVAKFPRKRKESVGYKSEEFNFILYCEKGKEGEIQELLEPLFKGRGELKRRSLTLYNTQVDEDVYLNCDDFYKLELSKNIRKLRRINFWIDIENNYILMPNSFVEEFKKVLPKKSDSFRRTIVNVYNRYK